MVDPLWLKEITKAEFEAPSKFLADIQAQISARGQSSVKSDRELVEKVSAAFLACGLNLVWGNDYHIEIISTFDDCGTDIDWMLRCSVSDSVEYVPVQVKTHFNEFWSSQPMDEIGYHEFLEDQFRSLSSYKNSQEVIFTIHVNKNVTLDISRLLSLARTHDFRGLFITGRASQDGSEYLISGDYLGKHTDFVCERFSLFNTGHFFRK